jgi:hypothetical protein
MSVIVGRPGDRDSQLGNLPFKVGNRLLVLPQFVTDETPRIPASSQLGVVARLSWFGLDEFVENRNRSRKRGKCLFIMAGVVLQQCELAITFRYSLENPLPTDALPRELRGFPAISRAIQGPCQTVCFPRELTPCCTERSL